MAMGMLAMLLPVELTVMPTIIGQIIFFVIAATIFAWIVDQWRVTQSVNLLWILSLLDMLAMVYMFASPQPSLIPLSALVVLFYFGATVAWMAGMLDDENRPFLLAFGPRRPVIPRRTLAGSTTFRDRSTLGAMAAGMAYMFLVM